MFLHISILGLLPPSNKLQYLYESMHPGAHRLQILFGYRKQQFSELKRADRPIEKCGFVTRLLNVFLLLSLSFDINLI